MLFSEVEPTRESRISPSQTLIRFGKTSSSKSVQIPRSKSGQGSSISDQRELTLTSPKVVNGVRRRFSASAKFVILAAPALHLKEFAIRCVGVIGLGADLRGWTSEQRNGQKHRTHQQTFILGIFTLADASAFGVAIFVQNACFPVTTLGARTTI